MSGDIMPSIFDGDDGARARFEALESEFTAIDRDLALANRIPEVVEISDTASMLIVAKRFGRFIGRNSVRLYTRPSFAKVSRERVNGQSVKTTTHAKSKIIGKLSTPGSAISDFEKTGVRHFSIARILISLGMIAFIASSIRQPFVESDQPSVDDVVRIIREHWPGQDAEK